MVQTTTSKLPSPSARTVERTLAVLLVGLLATYAFGTIANGVLPPLQTAGVVAVHLAVVIGIVFPVAVLGHAVVNRRRQTNTRPRPIEVGTAFIVLSCLIVGLWLGNSPMANGAVTSLLGIAVGGSLVRAGLVFGDLQ